MNKKWVIVITFLYLSLLTTLVIPIKKYQVTLPGNITSVSSGLIFENELENDFYTTYVVNYKKPTLFQMLTTKLSKSSKVSENTISDYHYDSYLDEDLSYQYAIISAYEKARLIDNDININYQITGYVVVMSKDKKILGNLFIKIDDLDLTTVSIEEVSTYLKSKDEITVQAYHNDKITNFKLTKREGFFNITLKPQYKITSSYPTYQKKYQLDKIGGPSGGLMQALYIYYQILNIKVNLTIAGTGTISATGQVGPIGGVAQKVFTVNNKVEIFFCPTEHFLEATKAFDKITNPSFKLVFVNNLDEAVKYLSNYE